MACQTDEELAGSLSIYSRDYTDNFVSTPGKHSMRSGLLTKILSEQIKRLAAALRSAMGSLNFPNVRQHRLKFRQLSPCSLTRWPPGTDCWFRLNGLCFKRADRGKGGREAYHKRHSFGRQGPTAVPSPWAFWKYEGFTAAGGLRDQ